MPRFPCANLIARTKRPPDPLRDCFIIALFRDSRQPACFTRSSPIWPASCSPNDVLIAEHSGDSATETAVGHPVVRFSFSYSLFFYLRTLSLIYKCHPSFRGSAARSRGSPSFSLFLSRSFGGVYACPELIRVADAFFQVRTSSVTSCLNVIRD